MAKRATMLDQVRATVRNRGPKRWYQTAPPDVMAELETVRTAYRRRELAATKSAIATALSKILAGRGITIGQIAITKWLDAD